jgi:hypothetical protein
LNKGASVMPKMEIKLWDLKEQIGYIDQVDLKILDYV